MIAILLCLVLATLSSLSSFLPHAHAQSDEAKRSRALCNSSLTGKSSDELSALFKTSQLSENDVEVECGRAVAGVVKPLNDTIVSCPRVPVYATPDENHCVDAINIMWDDIDDVVNKSSYTYGQRDDKGDTCSQADICLPFTRAGEDCRIVLDFVPDIAPESRLEDVDSMNDLEDAWYEIDYYCGFWT